MKPSKEIPNYGKKKTTKNNKKTKIKKIENEQK